MKSILFILDGGFDGGGAERVATILINGWIERGVKVVVLSLSRSKSEFYDIPDEVIRIYFGEIGAYSNFFSKAFHHIANMFKLRNAIQNNQSDVVLSFLTRTNIRTILATLGLGRRVVISERSDPYHQPYKWFWKLLRFALYRYANVVTANTHIALKYMQRFVLVGKLAYIHNPVVLPEVQAQPSTSKSILNVGRLVPLKAQLLIVEALAVAGVKDWNIDILGDGPEEKRLVTTAFRLGIQDQLHLHGFVKQTQKFYRNAGIFVLPSIYEGMSNALLEAMAFGLPCIISDTLPGALEHICHGKTGLVFEGGNAHDLADKLKILVASPELREKLGNAARKQVEKYSTDKVIQVWDKILFPQ